MRKKIVKLSREVINYKQQLKQIEEFYPGWPEEVRKNADKDIEILKQEIERVNQQLFGLLPDQVRTDDTIDLVGPIKLDCDPIEYYFICLHDGSVMGPIVGEINCRGCHTSNYGDIEYTIIESFRGHGYAYRALSLLGDVLKENGINEVWIAAENDNIASIKTIAKYGGTPIEMRDGEAPFNATLFSVQTRRMGDKPQIMQMNLPNSN